MCCCGPDPNPNKGDIVTDEVCGVFNIPCGEKATVWELDTAVVFGNGAQSAASVSIYYDKGCSDAMKLILTSASNTKHEIEIPKWNTRSYTFLNIIRAEIECGEKKETPSTERCQGKYCISLHYDVLETSELTP
ncbi:MAG: hypothetical protein RLZZ267_186 [Bacillota bacterium]|jgi:hypothetical protein